MKRIGVVFILVFAFCGLADSIYLAQHEASGTPLICNVQHLSDCNTVANSPYSYLFGIPLSEYGVLFYTILFVLAALELVLFDRLLRRVLQGVALVCLLSSIYFESVQVFFIGALCIYCLASAIITLIIFAFATLIEPLREKEGELPPSSAASASGEPAAPSDVPETPEGTRLSMPPVA
jgi:uncharacterized membrane protein